MNKTINEKLKIRAYGSTKAIAVAENMVKNIELTGREGDDRILIQNSMDATPGCADILYNGNGIYKYTKVVNEYKKMLRTNSLEKMSDYFYKFCTCGLSEIAHYNKAGFIDYFNDDPYELYSKLFVSEHVPVWKTDVEKILTTLLTTTLES